MGEQNLNIRIKHKYDTEANWNKNNPVLLSGEIAITSDKFGKHKVGDGTHKWSELSYAKAELTKGDVTGALGYTPPSSDTWRGIQDNLISSSTTESLSAAQGKILKELVDGKAPSSHTHTKSEVGLGNVDNTADATKSVKYATSAGSASSAAALTSNAGSSTQPVYFSGGKPVACSYTLGKSVPADALFTDHTYGNMKGATSSSAGSAGLVPAPNIGEQLKFLRADGAWVIPTNTTYSVGTSSYLGITKLYTETGSATDGTMTQNAITSALNGKSPTSHTHNYAGSSSSGGAATSAIKLSTPRKIGNASFDGTADITLSQMGLNVPVEITKANYLAKKKAGTLNANTYYNVIDEYDSANVINDSSVTANSAFSSTKSEKTYAKKSAIINTTLTASKWTGSSAPYTYVLPVSGATTSNIVEINYASNASSQAIEAYQNAMLADGGQTTNQITIKATEKPTVDIPITIVIRNDL
nr:MAG: Major tropism determinant N-terminal domain [Bacteriophage sp.]